MIAKIRSSKIIYKLNVADIQEVSEEVLGRRLNEKEIGWVQESVGDHIDWFAAIENAICQHIPE
jgi:hypothetical protein